MDSKDYSNQALEESYNAVSKQFSSSGFFQCDLLEESRKLFIIEEESRSIKPRKLDVVAVLVGLEFSKHLQDKVVSLQNELSNIILAADHYWVRPENLASEVAVLSWPENSEVGVVDRDDVIRFLETEEIRTFKLSIKGFQIHSDGCVILRVYDDGHVRGLRNSLTTEVKGFPNKQSSWCHIPLGRILSPLKPEACKELIEGVENSFKSLVFEEVVSSISLVHEKCWYMEDVEIVYRRDLND